MSEAVRAVALAEATKLKGDSGDAAVVLETANLYLAFLQGGATGPATRTAAGSEPAASQEAKPSATTAGAKKPAATDPKAAAKAQAKAAKEDAAAKAALAAAEAEGGEGDEPSGPTEPFEADKEGVSAAIAAMIANKTGEGPNRDTAITLLKKYKAASVSAMQAKDEATVTKFIDEVNAAFGLTGGEPDLES